MVMDCVGYFGRKEAIGAMLEEDLVKKLVELHKSKRRGVLMDLRGESKHVEQHPFSSCVARFVVQLEAGEGLRQREKKGVETTSNPEGALLLPLPSIILPSSISFTSPPRSSA
ncbi:hypothetical protein L6452_11559 [Arctium lappa]|uniref:Uncharacterized protein n=1 Tax=Arctium lappa TaxID=4217 RepID=A0ACB9DPA0_ARCLA|nr:hypothetical protein L6452_11559 [Arctium lappa]